MGGGGTGLFGNPFEANAFVQTGRQKHLMKIGKHMHAYARALERACAPLPGSRKGWGAVFDGFFDALGDNGPRSACAALPDCVEGNAGLGVPWLGVFQGNLCKSTFWM